MKYLIIFLLIFSQSLYADRRDELLNVIDEEIGEIVRLLKQNGQRPNLLLRMAELQFEKARLIKEEENKRFLEIPANKRSSINKSKFFAKSRTHFKKAEKVSRYLIKKFKNFKGKSDVLYILAFNAKEFGDEKGYQQYLKDSVSTGGGKGERGPKAVLALADNYYNKKKYKAAIPFYKKGLSLSDKDNWWSKYAYNLAWSYLRVKDYSNAISLMKKIYSRSKSGEYLDMSSQVERDMGYFYTMANKVGDGVQFYKSIGSDLVKNFVNIANYLEKQGKKTLAIKINEEALKHGPDDKKRRDIIIKIMELYEQFVKYQSHHKYTQLLLKDAREGDLSNTQMEQYLYQVKKVSSILQQRVADKSRKLSLQNRRSLGKLAISYFEILILLEKEKSYTWTFHKAETQYVSREFEPAAQNYKMAYLGAREANDSKFSKLAVEGLLAAVDNIRDKSTKKKEYVLDAFKTYISYSEKSKESKKIQQRLFTFYFNEKDILNAEQTLLSFKNNFPKDVSIHEAMLAKIMDHYKDTKNRDGIAKWVDSINKGQIVVGSKYKNQLRKLLLNMKFENVEKASQTGDKKSALYGYMEIFENSKNDPLARKNAAYNIAVILYEIGEIERSYSFTLESLKLMSNKDVYQYRDSFAIIADELFGRQRFKQSLNLYGKMLDKLCRYKNKIKNSIFKNIYVIRIATGDLMKVNSDIKQAQKCKISSTYRYDAMVALNKAYLEKGDFERTEKLTQFLSKNKRYAPSMIEPLYGIYQNYIKIGEMTKANQIKNQILNIGRRGKLPFEAREILVKFKLGEVEVLADQIQKLPLTFPEDVFNKNLKARLSILDRFTAKTLEVLRIGSGHGIVESYKVLHSNYLKFSNQIKNFTPPGKSSDYINSFKKGMQGLTQVLDGKANEFFNLGKKEILKQQILSPSNHYFTSDLKLDFPLEFLNPKRGVLMDKAGTP